VNAEIIKLADTVLESVDDWRYKATMFAMVNPMGFYVVHGVTLPQYLAKLNEMEAVWKKVKGREAA
jgi:hypothetical protein